MAIIYTPAERAKHDRIRTWSTYRSAVALIGSEIALLGDAAAELVRDEREANRRYGSLEDLIHKLAANYFFRVGGEWHRSGDL